MSWYTSDVHEVVKGLHARQQAGEALGRVEKKVLNSTMKPFRWRLMMEADDSEDGLGGRHLTADQRERLVGFTDEWKPPHWLAEATDRGNAVGRGARGGLLWGLDDEGKALGDSIGPGGQGYSEELGDQRIIDDLISANHFWPELGGEVLGSLPWMGAPLLFKGGTKALQWLASGSLPARIAKQSAVGAPIGAAVGFTEGRGGLENRLESAAVGVPFGMAFGAGGEVATSAIGAAWNRTLRNPALKASAAVARRVGAPETAAKLDAARGSVQGLSPGATQLLTKAYGDATTRFGPETAALNQFDEPLLGEMPGGFQDLTAVAAANDVPSSYYLKRALSDRAASGQQRLSDAADQALGSVKDGEDFDVNLEWARESLNKSYDRLLGLGMSDEQLMDAIRRGDPVPTNLFVDLSETQKSLDALGYTRGPEVAAFLGRMEKYLEKWGPLQGKLRGPEDPGPAGALPPPDPGVPPEPGPAFGPDEPSALRESASSGTAAFDPSGDPRFIGVTGDPDAPMFRAGWGQWAYHDPNQPLDFGRMPASEEDSLFTRVSGEPGASTDGGVPAGRTGAGEGAFDTAALSASARGEPTAGPGPDAGAAPKGPIKGFEPMDGVSSTTPNPGDSFRLNDALGFRAASARLFDNGRERVTNLAAQLHGVDAKRNEFIDQRLNDYGRQAADSIQALKRERAQELGIPLERMNEPEAARTLAADPEVAAEVKRLDDYMVDLEDHPEKVLAEYVEPNTKQMEGLERNLKIAFGEAIRLRKQFLKENDAWMAGAPKAGAVTSLLGEQSILPAYRKALEKAEKQLQAGDLHGTHRTMDMELWEAEDKLKKLVPATKEEQVAAIDRILAGIDMGEADRRTLEALRVQLGAVTDAPMLTDRTGTRTRAETEADEIDRKWAEEGYEAEEQIAREEAEGEAAHEQKQEDAYQDLVDILSKEGATFRPRTKDQFEASRWAPTRGGLFDNFLGTIAPGTPADAWRGASFTSFVDSGPFSRYGPDWRNLMPTEEKVKRVEELKERGYRAADLKEDMSNLDDVLSYLEGEVRRDLMYGEVPAVEDKYPSLPLMEPESIEEVGGHYVLKVGPRGLYAKEYDLELSVKDVVKFVDNDGKLREAKIVDYTNNSDGSIHVFLTPLDVGKDGLAITKKEFLSRAREATGEVEVESDLADGRASFERVTTMPLKVKLEKFAHNMDVSQYNDDIFDLVSEDNRRGDPEDLKWFIDRGMDASFVEGLRDELLLNKGSHTTWFNMTERELKSDDAFEHVNFGNYSPDGGPNYRPSDEWVDELTDAQRKHLDTWLNIALHNDQEFFSKYRGLLEMYADWRRKGRPKQSEEEIRKDNDWLYNYGPPHPNKTSSDDFMDRIRAATADQPHALGDLAKGRPRDETDMANHYVSSNREVDAAGKVWSPSQERTLQEKLDLFALTHLLQGYARDGGHPLTDELLGTRSKGLNWTVRELVEVVPQDVPPRDVYAHLDESGPSFLSQMSEESKVRLERYLDDAFEENGPFMERHAGALLQDMLNKNPEHLDKTLAQMNKMLEGTGTSISKGGPEMTRRTALGMLGAIPFTPLDALGKASDGPLLPIKDAFMTLMRRTSMEHPLWNVGLSNLGRVKAAGLGPEDADLIERMSEDVSYLSGDLASHVWDALDGVNVRSFYDADELKEFDYGPDEVITFSDTEEIFAPLEEFGSIGHGGDIIEDKVDKLLSLVPKDRQKKLQELLTKEVRKTDYLEQAAGNRISSALSDALNKRVTLAQNARWREWELRNFDKLGSFQQERIAGRFDHMGRDTWKDNPIKRSNDMRRLGRERRDLGEEILDEVEGQDWGGIHPLTEAQLESGGGPRGSTPSDYSWKDGADSGGNSALRTLAGGGYEPRPRDEMGMSGGPKMTRRTFLQGAGAAALVRPSHLHVLSKPADTLADKMMAFSDFTNWRDTVNAVTMGTRHSGIGHSMRKALKDVSDKDMKDAEQILGHYEGRQGEEYEEITGAILRGFGDEEELAYELLESTHDVELLKKMTPEGRRELEAELDSFLGHARGVLDRVGPKIDAWASGVNRARNAAMRARGRKMAMDEIRERFKGAGQRIRALDERYGKLEQGAKSGLRSLNDGLGRARRLPSQLHARLESKFKDLDASLEKIETLPDRAGAAVKGELDRLGGKVDGAYARMEEGIDDLMGLDGYLRSQIVNVQGRMNRMLKDGIDGIDEGLKGEFARLERELKELDDAYARMEAVLDRLTADRPSGALSQTVPGTPSEGAFGPTDALRAAASGSDSQTVRTRQQEAPAPRAPVDVPSSAFEVTHDLSLANVAPAYRPRPRDGVQMKGPRLSRRAFLAGLGATGLQPSLPIRLDGPYVPAKTLEGKVEDFLALSRQYEKFYSLPAYTHDRRAYLLKHFGIGSERADELAADFFQVGSYDPRGEFWEAFRDSKIGGRTFQWGWEQRSHRSVGLDELSIQDAMLIKGDLSPLKDMSPEARRAMGKRVDDLNNRLFDFNVKHGDVLDAVYKLEGHLLEKSRMRRERAKEASKNPDFQQDPEFDIFKGIHRETDAGKGRWHRGTEDPDPRRPSQSALSQIASGEAPPYEPKPRDESKSMERLLAHPTMPEEYKVGLNHVMHRMFFIQRVLGDGPAGEDFTKLQSHIAALLRSDPHDPDYAEALRLTMERSDAMAEKADRMLGIDPKMFDQPMDLSTMASMMIDNIPKSDEMLNSVGPVMHDLDSVTDVLGTRGWDMDDVPDVNRELHKKLMAVRYDVDDAMALWGPVMDMMEMEAGVIIESNFRVPTRQNAMIAWRYAHGLEVLNGHLDAAREAIAEAAEAITPQQLTESINAFEATKPVLNLLRQIDEGSPVVDYSHLRPYIRHVPQERAYLVMERLMEEAKGFRGQFDGDEVGLLEPEIELGLRLLDESLDLAYRTYDPRGSAIHRVGEGTVKATPHSGLMDVTMGRVEDLMAAMRAMLSDDPVLGDRGFRELEGILAEVKQNADVESLPEDLRDRYYNLKHLAERWIRTAEEGPEWTSPTTGERGLHPQWHGSTPDEAIMGKNVLGALTYVHDERTAHIMLELIEDQLGTSAPVSLRNAALHQARHPKYEGTSIPDSLAPLMGKGLTDGISGDPQALRGLAAEGKFNPKTRDESHSSGEPGMRSFLFGDGAPPDEAPGLRAAASGDGEFLVPPSVAQVLKQDLSESADADQAQGKNNVARTKRELAFGVGEALAERHPDIVGLNRDYKMNVEAREALEKGVKLFQTPKNERVPISELVRQQDDPRQKWTPMQREGMLLSLRRHLSTMSYDEKLQFLDDRWRMDLLDLLTDGQAGPFLKENVVQRAANDTLRKVGKLVERYNVAEFKHDLEFHSDKMNMFATILAPVMNFISKQMGFGERKRVNQIQGRVFEGGNLGASIGHFSAHNMKAFTGALGHGTVRQELVNELTFVLTLRGEARREFMGHLDDYFTNSSDPANRWVGTIIVQALNAAIQGEDDAD